MGYRVAVVGATGNVGREMLNILEEVKFPVEKMHAIASRKSIGVEVNSATGSSSARTSSSSTSPPSTSC
jgi:aspartate-semialdehyde dehydrogenase